MRKSILRFGALALMSMMSIGSWAQSAGTVFQLSNGCMYQIKNSFDGTDGTKRLAVSLIKATSETSGGPVVWSDTTSTKSGWTGVYSPTMGVTAPMPFVVTEIASGAFNGASISGGVQIPAAVTVFGTEALKGKTVTHVDFRNVTKIDVSAFQSADLSSVADDDHFTFDKCNPGNSAFMDAKFNSGATITLGSETTTVEGGAFGASSAMSDIEEVVIKDATGLTEIKVGAFKNRTNIRIFGYYNDNGMHYLPASLTTVGNNAFEGCNGITTFRFAANDKYNGKSPRITVVGAYAFKGCDWMDNDTFANVCTSFADFTYAAGSFQNCGFEGELDLSESAVTVTNKGYGNNPRNYENYPGVPKDAFAGNKIESVLLNDNFKVIQQSAFEGNNGLRIPMVLPSELWFIENNAFNTDATTPLSQDSLYLPESLRFVDDNAFANRVIKTVYAHPAITGDARKSDIPTLGTQTALTINQTYVPASEKFKYGTEAEQSLVYWYGNRGWQNVKFADLDLLTNRLSGSNDYIYIYEVNGVTYQIAKDFKTNTDNTDTENSYINDYGYIEAKVIGFTNAKPVLYGYIGLKNTQSLTDNSASPAIHKFDHRYQYPIVLKSNAFVNDIQATYPTPTNSAEDVSGISFYPMGAYDDDEAKTHADEIAVDDQAAYTGIPANICKGNIALVTPEDVGAAAPVIIGSGITTIGAFAFAGTTNLTAITLPQTLTTVCANAFADATRTAGLTSIELPATLYTIEANAFNAKSLKTVKVNYSSNPDCPIPTLPETAFATDANGLFIASLNIAGSGFGKKNYFEKDHWKKFFDFRATVQTATDKTLMDGMDQIGLSQIYTVDEDNDRDGYYTKYYVLEDNAKEPITQVKITGVTGTNVPVKYVRNFKEESVGKVQCWYVPFNFKFVPNDDYKFYYIYNTTQSSWEADAETRIGLKAVPNDKDADGNDLGYAIINANTPYIIVSKKSGNVDFYGEALTTTPGIGEVVNPVKVKDVKNEYTFAGVYQRKGGNEVTPWYGISNGAFIKFTDAANGINAFRFYMTALHQLDNPYNLVKFVFDDEEEDATGIKDVNAETIANGAMFDLMGRQITSPAKGQVYIQNGVKKLAK